MELPIAIRAILLVDNNFPSISQTFIVDKFLHLLIRGWDVHVLGVDDGDNANWDAYPKSPKQQPWSTGYTSRATSTGCSSASTRPVHSIRIRVSPTC